MLKLEFISFLLKITEVPISKIWVSPKVANSFLSCRDLPFDSHVNQPTYDSDSTDHDHGYCESTVSFFTN